jgi:nucleoside-diphosphate-sugar epimerase
MIAFVTGGTGFVGRRVVRELAAQGIMVRCLVRPNSNLDELNSVLGDELRQSIEIVRGDVGHESTYRAALEGVDVVYHLAASLAGSASTLFLDTVVPTRALTRASAAMQVRRFVLISSLGVYGSGNLRPWSILDETCPVDQLPHLRDAYSFSKIVQEQICRQMANDGGMPLVIMRPGVVIGPGRGALSNRLGLSLAGVTGRIGSSRQLPYTYVDNCAAAICLAGRTPDAAGETFNILDDDLPSVRDVLAAYSRHGHKVRSFWVPQGAIGPLSSLYEWYHHYSRGQLPGVVTRYRTDNFWKPLLFSNTKAKRLLAWTPHVPMAAALERTILSTAPRAA